MKTFADLKIGDTVFFIIGFEIRTANITGLGAKLAVRTSYENSKTELWDVVKDQTKCESYYGKTMYCNQSEAIIDMKEEIRKSIDEKVSEIERRYAELIVLKNEMFKYL